MSPDRAKLEDQLERWVGISHSSVEANMLASIAISMKRIADKMSAANSHAALLAAAKGAMQFVFKREILADEARAYLALQAAIAAAEESDS